MVSVVRRSVKLTRMCHGKRLARIGISSAAAAPLSSALPDDSTLSLFLLDAPFLDGYPRRVPSQQEKILGRGEEIYFVLELLMPPSRFVSSVLTEICQQIWFWSHQGLSLLPTVAIENACAFFYYYQEAEMAEPSSVPRPCMHEDQWAVVLAGCWTRT